MKILILDTNVPYANPTPRVLLSALARKADVVFGGLGFATDTSSIKALERRTGRFDVILGQTWMFGEPNTGQYGQWIPKDLHDHPAPKVLNLLQVDPHGLPEYIYERCVKPASLVINTAVSPQFRMTNITAQREKWFDANLFMTHHPEYIDNRWILIPHCMGESEFIPAGSVRKKWDVIVPGIKYWFRTAILTHLNTRKDVSLTSLDGKLQRGLYWATSYYNVQKHIDATTWFNRRFRNRIAACRIAVTCDGSIGYPIRKFFEIPAFGTILTARFFNNMEALGFVDTENCFALPDQFLDKLDQVIAFAQSDSIDAKRVTTAGQEMIREYHHTTKRAEQMINVLDALIAGKFGGTHWKNGHQIILPPRVGGL